MFHSNDLRVCFYISNNFNIQHNISQFFFLSAFSRLFGGLFFDRQTL